MKIALTGAHGTGKTTLCKFLGEETFRGKLVAYCRETPRVIIQHVNDDSFFRRKCNSPLRQSLIFLYQMIEEVKKYRDSELLICDRTAVDHLAYSTVLFPETLESQEHKALFEAVRSWISEYDMIFKLPIEFELEADGVRESDTEFQHQIDSSIDELYSQFGIVPITVRGSVERRAEQIGSIIQARLATAHAGDLKGVHSAQKRSRNE